jgi:hypothetical protein
MIDKFLPVGSVVLLDGGDKRVVIIGRGGRAKTTDDHWDYLGCPYPEGYIGDDNSYVFNHDQIARVFFIGLQDEEELALRDALLQASVPLQTQDHRIKAD